MPSFQPDNDDPELHVPEEYFQTYMKGALQEVSQQFLIVTRQSGEVQYRASEGCTVQDLFDMLNEVKEFLEEHLRENRGPNTI